MKALTFGEILWDIIDGKPYIGGAPFNLAAHLARMGGKVFMVSAIGQDELGRRAAERITGFDIDPRYVGELPGSATGTVDVFLDNEGHPDYTIHENTAWDKISLSAELLAEVKKTCWDVICFGTLAQRSGINRSLLTDILRGSESSHVFYDVNLRQRYYDTIWIVESLSASSIVKLNDDEVREISRLIYREDIGSAEDEKRFVSRITDDHELDTVIVTRGKRGSLVYNGGMFSEQPCGDVDIVDTVGAGDSYGAGFLSAYLSGHGAAESAEFASVVADFVVSKRGAIPEYSKELTSRVKSLL